MRLKRLLINLGLVAISLSLTILGLEILLRIFYPQPVDYFYFKNQWEPGETFERWGIEIRINSYGERDKEYAKDKEPGVYRIVFVGDSIEYGAGVAIEDTYHKQLERLLNQESLGSQRFEVLSFSNGGTEPSGYLEILQNSVNGFDPDLVIIGFTLNDFESPITTDQGGVREKTAKERLYDLFAEVHTRMRVASHLYFFVFERARGFLYKQQILDKWVRNRETLVILQAEGAEFEARQKLTEKNLRKIRDEAQEQGADLAIVVFPYEMQLSKELLNVYRTEYGLETSDDILKAKPQAVLRGFSEAENIPLVDLFVPFQEKASEGLYFREFGNNLDWVHPNARGHEIAASAIYNSLRCDNILPEDILGNLSQDGCQ